MKKLKAAIGVGLLLASLSITAYAATATIKNIIAQLRPDFVVNVNGMAQTFKDVNGDIVYPIVYEGTTYLPVRAIGELMDKDVFWDGDTKTIDLKPKNINPDDVNPVDGIAAMLPRVESLNTGNITKRYTAEVEHVVFSIISASGNTVTYNVQLFLNDGTLIGEQSRVPIGDKVTFQNLTPGEIYYFRISSFDASKDGANARYTVAGIE